MDIAFHIPSWLLVAAGVVGVLIVGAGLGLLLFNWLAMEAFRR